MTLVVGGWGIDMPGRAEGISVVRRTDAGLEPTGELLEAASPSWIAVRGDRMVATLEGSGSLAWFARSGEGWDPDGVTALGGDGPCHAAFLDDDTVVVACYGDGAVILARAGEPAPLQRLDGAGSGPLPAQDGPHAHHVLPLADGRILTLDLGADLLHVHSRDADGLLVRERSVALPSGTGPRDLALLPSGALALLGEWSCEVLVLDAETLEVRSSVALPGSTRGDDQASGLALTEDGRTLFAGIRGANRIAVLAVEGDELRAIDSVPSGGEWPRHVFVDGDLLHVSNQHSDVVATFAIDDSGHLGDASTIEVPSPTCVVKTTLQSLLS